MPGFSTLVELIEDAGILLKRAGSHLAGLCPFHDENTPSFHVFSGEDPQRYHCFGCGADGDAIEFLRRYYSLSFQEAARRTGKELPESFRGAGSAHARGPAVAKPVLSRLRGERFAAWDREMLDFVTGLHRTIGQEIARKQSSYRLVETATEPIHPEELADLEADFADLAAWYDKQEIVAEWCDLFTYDRRLRERYALFVGAMGARW